MAWGALLATLGCSKSTDESLVIFAASSLTDGFQDLATSFEETYPQLPVQLSFAGSQTLRLQIEQGAAADMIATANKDHLDVLKTNGHLSQSRVFAYNRLALIVPESNPSKLTGLRDLPLAQRIILGTEHVPIGQYTEELIQQADILWGDGYSDTVWSKVVSRESNARLVRAKVELGEADAAIVYQTDAMASSSLKMFPIPSSIDIQAQYHIGHTLQAEPMTGVHAWDEWLQSESARDILQHHGFGVP